MNILVNHTFSTWDLAPCPSSSVYIIVALYITASPSMVFLVYVVVCVFNEGKRACVYWIDAGMGILERKPLEECKEELNAKFWPTYKVCVCVLCVQWRG